MTGEGERGEGVTGIVLCLRYNTPMAKAQKQNEVEAAGDASVGVLGAGQMGGGIAQVCAMHGFQVVLYDNDAGQLAKAREVIGDSVKRLHDKGKIDGEQAAALERIEMCDVIDTRFRVPGVIIEAIVEDAGAKKRLYKRVGKHMYKDAVLASNTSSCSITELAAATPAPERFAGMHFMNPVPLMRLVEIIPGLQTNEAAVAKIENLARKLGKDTVRAADAPGFVANRVLMPLINEAIFALHENLASAEDIDKAMTLGMNHPMGPLQLADFIGLDTVLAVLEVMHKGTGDQKFRPCPLLRKVVAAGRLGKKTGRGFYNYDN